MQLDPQAVEFIKRVAESLEAPQKPGFFRRVFSSEAAPEASKSGLEGYKLGDYVFGSLIGFGSVGLVFEAKSAKLGSVAIKVLANPEEQEPTEQQLFEREVAIGQTLSHPAIAKTIETRSLGPARFVTMELLKGESLETILTEPLSPERYVDLFGPLSEGLDWAHAQGVVHRDIKPQNVMLTKDGHIKIVDFGLARWQGSQELTLSGQFKGTPMYSAPEQVKDSRQVDQACDQFAFGLMSFEALTGEFPYEIDPKQPFKTLFARLKTPAKKIRECQPHYSEALESALAKTMEIEPEDRFESVGAAFAELKRQLR